MQSDNRSGHPVLTMSGVEHRLEGWSVGEGALYERLAGAIEAAIDRGDILPGTRLPPERTLAKALSVGRSTVTAAYALLATRRIVIRRQGSGTWVEPAGDYAQGHAGELASRAHHRLFILNSFSEHSGAINLIAATPSAVPAVGDLADEAAAEIRRNSAHHGYWPLGLPALRTEIAKRLTSRGLETTEAEILVTNGAQQAIALIATAFVGPGELAALEDPTYPGAIDAFRQTGARILSVTVGPEGIDLNLLDDVLTRADIKVIYSTPSFQNPTGVVMPIAQRRRLAHMAAANEAILIEDEAHAEIALEAPAPPPVAAFNGGPTIVTIGSLSKLFWGGLRVGWIRAPQPVLSHLARLKAILDLSSPLPSQVLAALLLQRADAIIPSRVSELHTRSNLLSTLISTSLPGWGFSQPAGGLVLWPRILHGSASEFAEHARSHGVLVLPGPMTSANSWFDDHVRLPYVHGPDILEEGMARLARAWDTYVVDDTRSRTARVIG